MNNSEQCLEQLEQPAKVRFSKSGGGGLAQKSVSFFLNALDLIVKIQYYGKM